MMKKTREGGGLSVRLRATCHSGCTLKLTNGILLGGPIRDARLAPENLAEAKT